jgi:hypothetical protein
MRGAERNEEGRKEEEMKRRGEGLISVPFLLRRHMS